MGVGQLDTASQAAGVPSIARLLAIEPLISLGPDGRVTATLAQRVETAADGSLRIYLRPNVTFHDGTQVNAEVVAAVLRRRLPAILGPAAVDVGDVSPINDHEIRISQKKSSPFLSEALDFPIEKPDAPDVGTGPFAVVGHDAGIELKANEHYYLGAPAIQRIVLRSYPTVRAAWAEMLRGNLDMLYEVGPDALDSLQASSQVSVYTFSRSYAYVIVLNLRSAAMRDPQVRVALNTAIDRQALIRDALDNHGTPAAGPTWPHHWAYNEKFPAFKYDPSTAARTVGTKMKFKCIFAGGPIYERLALAVQHQLAAVGINVELEATTIDDLTRRVTQSHDFDAVLFDVQLAPNFFKGYAWWHSGGPNNFGQFGSAKVDAALDIIRYAKNDGEYAAGALEFQKAMIDDPPAIFLAWGERARAVNQHFQVPHEPDQDILHTLRLWKPAEGQPPSSRN